MATTETFTIAQLHYAVCPGIQFRKLVGDLRDALSKGLACDVIPVCQGDATAAFELPCLRLVLDYRRSHEAGFDHCLVIASGPSDDHGNRQRIDDSLRAQLVRTIVKRVTSRYPADRDIWSDCPGALTEEGLEDALDALTCEPPEPVRERTDLDRILENCARPAVMPSGAAAVSNPPAPVPRAPTYASDGSAALAYLPEADDETEPQGAAEVIAFCAPFDIANDVARTAALLRDDAARVRDALFAKDDEAPKQSIALRLAAHTMNATLMIVWLPAGAAMMTYSVLRGEDLTTSARALAIMATATGLLHLPIASQVLASI